MTNLSEVSPGTKGSFKLARIIESLWQRDKEYDPLQGLGLLGLPLRRRRRGGITGFSSATSFGVSAGSGAGAGGGTTVLGSSSAMAEVYQEGRNLKRVVITGKVQLGSRAKSRRPNPCTIIDDAVALNSSFARWHPSSSDSNKGRSSVHGRWIPPAKGVSGVLRRRVKLRRLRLCWLLDSPGRSEPRPLLQLKP
ncbi:hypothetical protein NL676_016417 [Syzygium grande]|nr:hypothetical protein NL676_016417 [Syzygium grande]